MCKKITCILAAVLIFAGCAAQTPSREPAEADFDAPETAQQAWTFLSEELCPPSLSRRELCLLFGCKETELSEGIGFFLPQRPQEGQLFLLRPAPKKEEKLRRAMEERLELCRQSTAAWFPEEQSAEAFGQLLQAGEWLFLVIPGSSDRSTAGVQQAAELFIRCTDLT